MKRAERLQAEGFELMDTRPGAELWWSHERRKALILSTDTLRRAPGEFEASPVVDYLNSCEPDDPLVQLITMNHALAVEPMDVADLRSRIRETANEFIRHAHLAFAPSVNDVTAQHWSIGQFLVGAAETQLQLAAFLAILQLVSNAEYPGLLLRFQRCQLESCARWYYQRALHQRFCCEPCERT